MDVKEAVLTALREEQEKGSHVILPGTQSIPFGDRFKELERKKSVIAFVDGGNVSVLNAPNFTLHLIRTYATVYEGTQRIEQGRYEGYLLVRMKEMNYETEWFGIKGSTLSIPLDDETLSFGKHNVTPEAVANQSRHLAELDLARKIVSRLERGAAIILDGDCQAHSIGDNDAWKQLRAQAEQAGITIAGLSKTTRLTTNTGSSVMQSIGNPQTAWGYCPIAQNEKLTIGLVKLHKNSKYVFRLDTIGGEQEWRGIADRLSYTSHDAAFLGYPYPLQEAHMLAKVTKQEAELASTELLASDNGKLHQAIRALDAHDRLDSLK